MGILTMGLPEVREETGAPVYVNRKDAFLPGERASSFKFGADEKVNFYKEGDTVKVGNLEFHVLETPGHSPGSVVLLCENAMFSGDTLFRDSCGRTDLEGGDMNVILSSLRRLASLEGNYEVYPGHMDVTDLDRERRFNYYMNFAVNESGK